MSGGPVTIDLRPAQSHAYRERGVARHTLEFTRAVIAGHADLVGDVLVDPPIAPIGDVDGLVALGGARPAGGWGGRAGGLFHLTSPFDLDVPVPVLWPRAASSMGLVVTVYDLIPDVFADQYLADPGQRRRWRTRRELVRAADHVLTLSVSSAGDVTERLGVAERRVTVIGAGCSERFHPPAPGEDPGGDARRLVPGLREPFAVYNGAADPRKNLERLLEAWALLAGSASVGVGVGAGSASAVAGPAGRCQLVLVGRMDPLQRNHYQQMAVRLGIAGDVLFAGVVPDSTLVRLYQSTRLMVFPSLHEGYGLPVVEAQACGAPVVASGTSSLVELVGEEARFDPYDVRSMASIIGRALSDDAFAARLRADAARRPPPAWSEVADRAAMAYEKVLGSGLPRRSRERGLRRRAVALVEGPDGIPSADAVPASPAVVKRLDGFRGGYGAVVLTAGAGGVGAGVVGAGVVGAGVVGAGVGLGSPGAEEPGTGPPGSDAALSAVLAAALRLSALDVPLVVWAPGLADVAGGLLDEPLAGVVGELAARCGLVLVPSELAGRRIRSRLPPELGCRIEVVAGCGATEDAMSALVDTVRRHLGVESQGPPHELSPRSHF